MKGRRLAIIIVLALFNWACDSDSDNTSVLTIDNGNNDGFDLHINGVDFGRVPGCSRGTEIEVDVEDPCAYVEADAPWAVNCVWSCLDLTGGRDWNLCCASEITTCFLCE